MAAVTEKKRYSFKGTVWHYDSVVASNWKAETMAVSEKQARNNIAFQYRSKHGFMPNYNLRLEGKIVLAQ